VRNPHGSSLLHQLDLHDARANEGELTVTGHLALFVREDGGTHLKLAKVAGSTPALATTTLSTCHSVARQLANKPTTRIHAVTRQAHGMPVIDGYLGGGPNVAYSAATTLERIVEASLQLIP